jgi:hypothetical protein
MTSWRDTASPQAQADLGKLLSTVVPLAEQYLARHGEFFSFGAGVSADGQVALLGGDPGLGERPESQAVLDLLYEAARDPAPGYRAVAFAADVRADEADAIRIELEHREGTVLAILIPYERNARHETIIFGRMRASAEQARIW